MRPRERARIEFGGRVSRARAGSLEPRHIDQRQLIENFIGISRGRAKQALEVVRIRAGLALNTSFHFSPALRTGISRREIPRNGFWLTKRKS